MASLEDLDDLEREEQEQKKEGGDDKKDGGSDDKSGDAEMKDADKEEEEEDILGDEILSLSTRDIVARRRLLENDLRIMKSEYQRLGHEKATMNEKIKDNVEKIENNRYGSLLALQMTYSNTVTDNYLTSSGTSSRSLI
jgi:26S proteasome regulatory subunit T5